MADYIVINGRRWNFTFDPRRPRSPWIAVRADGFGDAYFANNLEDVVKLIGAVHAREAQAAAYGNLPYEVQL